MTTACHAPIVSAAMSGSSATSSTVLWPLAPRGSFTGAIVALLLLRRYHRAATVLLRSYVLSDRTVALPDNKDRCRTGAKQEQRRHDPALPS